MKYLVPLILSLVALRAWASDAPALVAYVQVGGQSQQMQIQPPSSPNLTWTLRTLELALGLQPLAYLGVEARFGLSGGPQWIDQPPLYDSENCCLQRWYYGLAIEDTFSLLLRPQWQGTHSQAYLLAGYSWINARLSTNYRWLDMPDHEDFPLFDHRDSAAAPVLGLGIGWRQEQQAINLEYRRMLSGPDFPEIQRELTLRRPPGGAVETQWDSLSLNYQRFF
jgi:hypothetical protein